MKKQKKYFLAIVSILLLVVFADLTIELIKESNNIHFQEVKK